MIKKKITISIITILMLLLIVVISTVNIGHYVTKESSPTKLSTAEVQSTAIGDDDIIDGDINVDAGYEDYYSLTFDVACGGYMGTFTIGGKPTDSILPLLMALPDYKQFAVKLADDSIWTVKDSGVELYSLEHYAEEFSTTADNVFKFSDYVNSSNINILTFSILAQQYPSLSTERFKVVLDTTVLFCIMGDNIKNTTPNAGNSSMTLGATYGSLLEQCLTNSYVINKYPGYHLAGFALAADGEMLGENELHKHKTLFYIYKPNIYNITLRYLDANGVITSTVLRGEHGAKLKDVLATFEPPMVEGKRFTGWNIREDVILFKSMNYTVHINDKGVGTVDQNTIIEPDIDNASSGFLANIYNSIQLLGQPWSTLIWSMIILVAMLVMTLIIVTISKCIKSK